MYTKFGCRKCYEVQSSSLSYVKKIVFSVAVAMKLCAIFIISSVDKPRFLVYLKMKIKFAVFN